MLQETTACASRLPGRELRPSPPALTTFHYELLALPVSVLYNTTGLDSPLEDARHGMRASLSVDPTLSFGHPGTRFFITQASISYYLDLHDSSLTATPGRSVLALRALAGLAHGAGQFSLPPDQRFYAGGSGTIRGYRYQSVGPLFPDGNPIGGTAISAGNAGVPPAHRHELRHRRVPRWRPGERQSEPAGWHAALRRRRGRAVLHADRADPAGCRHTARAAGPRTHYAGLDGPTTPFEIYIGLGQAF